MYELTGERKWLDWAVNITDHFVDFSDVNGDGQPAWGNYNETWGSSLYDYREYTVWDGVIGLPVIEAARVIMKDRNLSADPELSARANRYIELIRRIVLRHHKAWTQAGPGEGYYWDDPTQDVGPIVNRFTALGRAELVLGDVTGNSSYYDRPREMAKYIVHHLRYNEAEDLYTWDYDFEKGGSEDISHGAIELEFLIMAGERGLLNETHLRRLCNTYLKRVWQVPEILDGKHLLAMKVDGSDPEKYDYADVSRGWILLAPYDPLIFDCQRTVFGILNEKRGLYPSGVRLLGLAQIPLMARMLEEEGKPLEEGHCVDIGILESMYDRVEDRLKEAQALGSRAEKTRQALEEALRYINEEALVNASVTIGLMWRSWNILGVMIDVGERIKSLSELTEEARGLGLNVSAFVSNLSRIEDSFADAEESGMLGHIDREAANLTAEIQKTEAWFLIQLADQVVEKAKELGLDTKRHEILLGRAHEEFEKGNYVSAKQFTTYPLTLQDEVEESGLSVASLFGMSVLLPALKRRGMRLTR